MCKRPSRKLDKTSLILATFIQQLIIFIVDKVVRNEYERMAQKEEINLVVIVFEVQVGTGELGLDDLPKPVHW